MLLPRSHTWTRLQRVLLVVATLVAVASLCALVFMYERHYRGATEDALVGTWQEYDPEGSPEVLAFYYRFNADRTYEAFTRLPTGRELLDEKGIWHAGGDFIYLGRPFDYAASGAVVIWRIEEFSPNELKIRYNPGSSIFTYRRVHLDSPTASNKSLKPTPLPVVLLSFMPYPRVMKPRPQRRGLAPSR